MKTLLEKDLCELITQHLRGNRNCLEDVLTNIVTTISKLINILAENKTIQQDDLLKILDRNDFILDNPDFYKR